MVHWLPAAFGISNYGGPLLPHLVSRAARQNVGLEKWCDDEAQRDEQSTHCPSNFICRVPLLVVVGCGTSFIGDESLKAPVIPAIDFARDGCKLFSVRDLIRYKRFSSSYEYISRCSHARSSTTQFRVSGLHTLRKRSGQF